VGEAHEKQDEARRFPAPRPGNPEGPATFDFLGFTHHWGTSLRGKWIVKQRTGKDRFSRALRRMREWCRAHRHDPIRAQQQALAQKLRGLRGKGGDFQRFLERREL